MEIQSIEQADFNLVELREGKPHCKKHGIMERTTSEGLWRCECVTGFYWMTNGDNRSEKNVETICKAGCCQL